jgi:8-oxo-dGTP pyrophosphatase MutT (NUDIX family)
LPKRADTKKFLPGLYEMPGGHIDYGEDLIEGLKREIKEEHNMAASIGDPFAAFTYQNLVKGSQTIEVIYFARFSEPLENIVIHPEDHSKYEWFTKAEVLKRKAELTAIDNITYAHEEDPEYLTILKGFDLLDNQSLDFG